MPACPRPSALVYSALVVAFVVSGANAADLSVTFADPAWDGKNIPDGQQCNAFWRRGGNACTAGREHPG